MAGEEQEEGDDAEPQAAPQDLVVVEQLKASAAAKASGKRAGVSFRWGRKAAQWVFKRSRSMSRSLNRGSLGFRKAAGQSDGTWIAGDTISRHPILPNFMAE
jgi:hypothetical protein